MQTPETQSLPMPVGPSGPSGTAAPPPERPGGWLGGPAAYQERQDRKIFGGVGLSLMIHAGLFLLIFGVFAVHKVVTQEKQDDVKVVFLEAPKVGGGGGGSPAPAAPKKVQITPPKPSEPVPVPTVPPPPSLTAPVESTADLLQMAGASGLAMLGGGGSGGGIGSGHGNGIGPGEGGGMGGGVYAPGSNIINPEIITKTDPIYTAEAMRAKIQGLVRIEGTVQTNGKLTDLKVVQSLDRQFGLDEAAKQTVLKWVFAPGRLKTTNQPVPVRVTIELQYTLR